MENKLVQEWLLAKTELGVQVNTSYCLELKNGRELRPIVHIPNFGATNGMLIFLDYAEISSIVEEIISEGYGYSVLSEPSDQETFFKSDYRDMLSDWGWFGNAGDKPDWA